MANPNERVSHALVSDLGMRRMNNQDAAIASIGSAESREMPGDVFLVADGMGAHAAGELASQIAVDNVPHLYRKSKETAPQGALRQAVQNTNELIFQKGQSSSDFNGMGTTCTCLLLLERWALVAHVGDSRVYRLRDGLLEQLTFDHSLVWELAKLAARPLDLSTSRIPKNIITRSLGPHPMVQVDLEGPFPLAAGDTFVICSDGLTAVVDDPLLGAIVGAMSPAEAAQTLVDVANLRGGPDNITVVVTRVNQAPTSSQPATPAPPRGNLFRIIWALILVLFSLGGVLLFAAQQQRVPTLLSAVALGASAMLLFTGRRLAQAPAPGDLGGPYGDGPYRKIDCLMGAPAAEALGGVARELDQLRNPATGPEDSQDPITSLRWDAFDSATARATVAQAAGDAQTAVAEYASAIRSVMQQVRGGLASRANESVL